MINRTPVRDGLGVLGWRRGSQYRRSRVMPGEGRGLSSRQTQDVVRDLEIGQPSNSEKCSETADGVTRESEGGSRLSLLRPVRQVSREDILAHAYAPVPLQQELAPAEAGRAPGIDGQDFADIEAYGVVRWLAELALALRAGDIPAGADQTRVHTEGQWQTQAAGHLDRAGSGLHDSSDAGAGADLRSRSSIGNLRLLRWAKRPRTCGFPCIRLSDKTPRLRPRRVAPKPFLFRDSARKTLRWSQAPRPKWRQPPCPLAIGCLLGNCPAQTRTHSIEFCAVLCGTAEHVVRFCVDLCASSTKAKPTGPICRCGPQR